MSNLTERIDKVKITAPYKGSSSKALPRLISRKDAQELSNYLSQKGQEIVPSLSGIETDKNSYFGLPKWPKGRINQLNVSTQGIDVFIKAEYRSWNKEEDEQINRGLLVIECEIKADGIGKRRINDKIITDVRNKIVQLYGQRVARYSTGA